jgi:hypothetical protein
MAFGDDIFGGPFGDIGDIARRAQNKKKPEKGLPWEAKIIDGVYYIPLSQVSDLLRENDVLPAVRRGIENRVSAQKLRVQMQEEENRGG